MCYVCARISNRLHFPYGNMTYKHGLSRLQLPIFSFQLPWLLTEHLIPITISAMKTDSNLTQIAVSFSESFSWYTFHCYCYSGFDFDLVLLLCDSTFAYCNLFAKFLNLAWHFQTVWHSALLNRSTFLQLNSLRKWYYDYIVPYQLLPCAIMGLETYNKSAQPYTVSTKSEHFIFHGGQKIFGLVIPW